MGRGVNVKRRWAGYGYLLFFFFSFFKQTFDLFFLIFFFFFFLVVSVLPAPRTHCSYYHIPVAVNNNPSRGGCKGYFKRKKERKNGDG